MKKLLIMAVVLLLSLAGCSGKTDDADDAGATDAATKFTAGTYTGEGAGFHGTLKVEVEVDAEKILSVTVTEHEETPGYGTNAVDQLPGVIVDAQSLAVDVIAGATFSSNAILDAVEAALVAAGANAEELR